MGVEWKGGFGKHTSSRAKQCMVSDSTGYKFGLSDCEMCFLYVMGKKSIISVFCIFEK